MYSDESLEQLRDSCKEARDLAMIDLLTSTGIRVGELVQLNRRDIDFDARECVVHGKGRLRKLGDDSGVKHVHPHKFRRTLATKAIDKGMPIEQVQVLLGHSKIDTTLCYAQVDQDNVKRSHRKFIS